MEILSPPHDLKKKPFIPLFVGALGVVFGDIGTSPLYAFREGLSSHHSQTITPEFILSLLSLTFWTIMIIVSIKYVTLIMRADNNGEGGSLALLALIVDSTKKSPFAYWAVILGLCGTAFFYGDCMLTPAISVLSAIEGLIIIQPNFQPYIIPITLLGLTGLFLMQRRGTEKIGQCFGPVMTVWFLTIAVLGIVNIINVPSVLAAISPTYALSFLQAHPMLSFFVLGNVFLSVTGGEALYADMGHFGRSPIRLAWFSIVMPALMLNYFGQGALLLDKPESISNPFFLLAPPMFLFPLVILATLATIIASQSVISGAFSVFRQAVQLDYLPRITIVHTSGTEEGQIYVPFANWTLYTAVMALVIFFQTSSNLAGAYGIAVAGTMIITTMLVSVVMKHKWNWATWQIALVIVPLFLVDFVFILANSIKIPNGGWFSLLVGTISFIFLYTWKQGRNFVCNEVAKQSMPLDKFISQIDEKLTRVPGTAVVLTGQSSQVPSGLLTNLKHNQVMHERVILITVITEDIPHVKKEKQLELTTFEKGFYRLVVRTGFMQHVNIPHVLANCSQIGLTVDLAKASYFLSHATIIPTHKYKMATWRKHLFVLMAKNATNAVDYFHIPCGQVVELGVRHEI